jgi:hypothetical protein
MRRVLAQMNQDRPGNVFLHPPLEGEGRHESSEARSVTG